MGFVAVACNFCGSTDAQKLFDIHENPDERQPPAWRGNESIPMVRCRRCALVYLNPRYDEERLVAVYQDPQMFVGTIDPDGRSRSIVNERPERVERFRHDVESLRARRPSGRLLDIGCGLAFFLEALGGHYDATGLEWSAPVVRMASHLPYRIVEARFPSHPFGAAEFDIVTYHNTLDHLPDPMAALRETVRLLKPGGLLMLTSINFGSIAASLYGPGYRLLGPNHLYYFTPASLDRYFMRVGLRLDAIEYPYFGTPFARPVQHLKQILRDAWDLKVRGVEETRVSPPFYGNMMRVYATRAIH